MAYPHVPAAFINVIAESGDKAEAVKHLQETWNEVVALRGLLREVDDYFRDGWLPDAMRARIRAALANITLANRSSK